MITGMVARELHQQHQVGQALTNRRASSAATSTKLYEHTEYQPKQTKALPKQQLPHATSL
jgi:hypothetical protein